MSKVSFYPLAPDKRGMLWDILLYVPTVAALTIISLKLWYSPNQFWSYLLFFMACFFFIVGANRVLSTRLMVLPNSPRGIGVMKNKVSLTLKNGSNIELVNKLRFYSDYAGKSFGLTGIDMIGRQRQYVFHRGQFADQKSYKKLLSSLRVYK